jgi:recombinational DNA repair ATPase RecF
MLAAALMLAQQAQRTAMGQPPACLLVDDPAAELDVDNLGKLLAALSKIKAQLVITARDPSVLENHLWPRLFHVKHGALQ